MFIASPPPSAEVLLELNDFRIGPVGPVSLKLNVGEILGLVGLRGAGQDLIGRAVFGDVGYWKKSGSMRLHGRQLGLDSPAAAMRNRIAFVSSRRAEEGLAGILTVRENIFANPAMRAGLAPVRFIGRRQEQHRILDVLERFDVRPRDPERAIATLSGGNQQKALVARWLEAHSELLVLESPTFGVDVGAKHEIYSILEQQVAAGAGVLLVSSDFEEVAGISHRALVFRRGKVIGEVRKEELSVQRLTEMASGAEETHRGEAA
jgi:ribose transport system ATP-binding protein